MSTLEPNLSVQLPLIRLLTTSPETLQSIIIVKDRAVPKKFDISQIENFGHGNKSCRNLGYWSELTKNMALDALPPMNKKFSFTEVSRFFTRSLTTRPFHGTVMLESVVDNFLLQNSWYLRQKKPGYQATAWPTNIRSHDAWRIPSAIIPTLSLFICCP